MRRSRRSLRTVPSTAADMAVGARAHDVEGGGEVGHGSAAFEQHAQSFDQGGGPLRQIGQGALADLAGVAIGLAKQDGGRGVPVGDGFDVHGHLLSPCTSFISRNISDMVSQYMATFRQISLIQTKPGSTGYTEIQADFSRKFRLNLCELVGSDPHDLDLLCLDAEAVLLEQIAKALAIDEGLSKLRRRG